MAQKIQLLDQHTINKIAAGEVVESPKSVVKELVENAIDAGATSITVEIKEGGISYIRITDNGCGIPKEQVKVAFLRHATNKIVHIEDLEAVISLGFRGEALASIAAVAQVEMTTKTQEEDSGTYIEINGGEIIQCNSTACTKGTSIVVKNLFYNVPARRKFLKKPATESSYISELLNKIALGHPTIAFQYINNSTTILHTSGNHDRRAAVLYVYGKETAAKMLELHYTKGGYTIQGLIGKPELSRANRSYGNLFINGRYIKSKIVSSAIEEAYKTRLLIGKFPVYVLDFILPPSCVDVNVHPAKLEVRFQNDDEIYQIFYEAVSKAFENEVLIPKVDWNSRDSKEIEAYKKEKQIVPIQELVLEKKSPVTYETEEKMQFSTMGGTGFKSVDDLLHKNKKKTLEVNEDIAAYVANSVETTPISYEVKQQQTLSEIEEKRTRDTFFQNYTIIGQFFRTYWAVEQGKSIFMIDQHAAHERILYEKLMDMFRNEDMISQILVQPLLLQFSEREKEVFFENKELLQKFGFTVTQIEQETFALSSVPVIIKGPTGTQFFLDLLDILGETNIQNLYDTKILTIATMACKAAVKGNDRLSIQEATAMIEQLLSLENPFTCPHGRPTIIEMTQYELEKRFKRIQN